jgi:hypothetical protein
MNDENVQKIYYQKTHITIKGYPIKIRKGICKGCNRSKHEGEIKTTQLHHTKYAFETQTVLKNPILALENTLELCFGCHPIADGLRDILLANPRGGLRKIDKIIQVINLLPPEQQLHFTHLCRTWLKNGK